MRSIMDVKDKIRFPMSPETFIEIQEYISCKTIDDKDKGILLIECVIRRDTMFGP